MPISVISDDGAFQDKLKSAGNQLVVVDFNLSWCEPFQISEQFEELSDHLAGHATFLKVDVDICRQTSRSNWILSTPTCVFYRVCKEIARSTGASPDMLQSKIEELITLKPSKRDDGDIIPGHFDPDLSLDQDLSLEQSSASSDQRACPLSGMPIDFLSLLLNAKPTLKEVLRKKERDPRKLVSHFRENNFDLYEDVFNSLPHLIRLRKFPDEESTQNVRCQYVHLLLVLVLESIKKRFAGVGKLADLFGLEVVEKESIPGDVVSEKRLIPDFVVRGKKMVGNDAVKCYVLVVKVRPETSGFGFRQGSAYTQQICELSEGKERAYGLSSNGTHFNLITYQPDEGFKLSKDMEFMFAQMFEKPHLNFTSKYFNDYKLIIDLVYSVLCEKLDIPY